MMTGAKVNLTVEVPEALYGALNTYQEQHVDWERDRLFCAALSLFLMQNGSQTPCVSRIYLDSLFGYPLEASA
ncbi:MAG: DUF2811 domain-containing protein [Cyanobacteria bacterium P01_H01_bin.119]